LSFNLKNAIPKLQKIELGSHVDLPMQIPTRAPTQII